MKVHSDVLTEGGIRESVYAAGMTGVEIVSLSVGGSRKRKNRFEVKLSGNSPYRTADGNHKAATWDEWGMFIEQLFCLDEDAIVGDYKDYATFQMVTEARFSTLYAGDQHLRHKWEYNRWMDGHECECGAVWMPKYLRKDA